ncbi:YbjQ family protein [Patulibacter defluvii]|uniref:YbjQ family protein n=1 Tax=Patulibacter defluvii TaxID=3095358 RepID=UPI002A75A891|nr:YbjQ family protein [Patulibacter sp. DM4]
MLIVTTNDVPGHRIDEVIGEVFGLTVRSRNVGSNIGAGFKSLVGGELKGITKMLHDSRAEALERLSQEAEERGANAILAFRFETNEYASVGTEVCAYGTAVRISPA